MATPNSQIFNDARQDLSGKWGTAIVTFIVYIVVSMVAGFVPFGSIVLGGPLALGIAIFSLHIVRRQEAATGDIFKGFDNFGNSMLALLLVALFTVLWMLLLIIPGIIKAYSYSMTFYILADNPTMQPMQAVDRSMEMMDGYKLKLFTLQLRFMLLAILCIFTLGIGFFFLWPYASVTTAKFYEDLKAGQAQPEVMNEINSIQ